jgi:DNA-binding CsgD family transcriptional regulator
MVTGALAWCHILAAQIQTQQARTAALAQAAALLGEVPAGNRAVSSLGERWIVFAHAYLAQAHHDPAASLALFGRVTAPSVDESGGQAVRPSLTPRPALGRAMALLALGRHEEAEPLLLGVQEVVQRQGARPLIWRCHLALGDLYQATGRIEQAQHAYLTARQLVEVLAAGLPDPDLGEQFSRRMLSLLPRAYRPAARQASAASRQGGLTAREREVAILIAAGQTNREIAEALVLGERTIETHVSNILGKLELASRREVARWAAEHGLT